MAASFVGGTATISFAAVSHRKLVITSSVKPNTVKVNCDNNQDSNRNNGRRDVMFAAAAGAAAAICSVAGVAVAQEPKRGTPEAKKSYAAVCVANPTAKICNN